MWQKNQTPMCGRYTIAAPPEELRRRFDVQLPEEDFQPNFNAAPTQNLPVIRQESGKTLDLFKWGLVPFWAKEASIGNKMINARAESVFEKPAFKQAIHKRRCLVPATGFFEWKVVNGKKEPFYIRPGATDHLFVFAGIWEKWDRRDGQPLYTFSILTKEAEGEIASLHHRMPVILPQEAEDDWLQTTSQKEMQDLINAATHKEWEYHQVSRKVNAPSNNDQSLIRPL